MLVLTTVLTAACGPKPPGRVVQLSNFSGQTYLQQPAAGYKWVVAKLSFDSASTARSLLIDSRPPDVQLVLGGTDGYRPIDVFPLGDDGEPVSQLTAAASSNTAEYLVLFEVPADTLRGEVWLQRVRTGSLAVRGTWEIEVESDGLLEGTPNIDG